jgi:hypothetical protein
MSDDVVVYLIGVLCLGLATGVPIRLSPRLSVATAAALGPSVAWSGLATNDPRLLAAYPCLVFIGLLVNRRSAAQIASHLVLHGAVLGGLATLRAAGVSEPLFPTVGFGVAYLLGEFGFQRLRARGPLLSSPYLKPWLLLEGVLLCACGLTTLGVQRLEWPAFLAMAFVLLLTKREFEAFVDSQAAYTQTLDALNWLREQESRALGTYQS